MLVGESPGPDESAPFAGEAGLLLNKMLLTAGLSRGSCFLAEAVRCRTPEGRPPKAAEVAACKGWLWREIRAVKPRVIVAFGKTPARLLLRGDSRFSLADHVGVPTPATYLEGGIVVAAYHPSYLLRHKRELIDATIRTLIKARNFAQRTP
jgi:DNA polymerase